MLWSAATLAGSAAGTPLPDGRAYEMVSPPDKGGAEVIQQTAKTHVAADGNGVTFSALGGFGELLGTSFDAEFLSRRTGEPGTNGWTTHGINPAGRSITLLAEVSSNTPTYVNAFTPDLSAGIYKSWRPLTDAPNVADVSNLYRIGGLGTNAMTAQLMSDGVSAVPPWPTTSKGFFQPAIAGASVDLRHVLFESRLALTADAPPYQGLFCVALGFFCRTLLYENVDGVVRLVGRIPNQPDTTCDDVNGPACIVAESAQAGISATLRRYSGRMISADGRRIFFQVPAGQESGAIYLREDGTRTVQLAQDGELWGASADGSRVFFLTSESLTPDDTNGTSDLYMYDSDAPSDDRLTLISAGSAGSAAASAVVGVSGDGRYAYFTSDGQLLPGEPTADVAGLYVWHDGTLRYIGKFVDAGEVQLNGPRTEWSFPGSMSTSRVSPDGRHLLFMAISDEGFRGREGFTGYDHAGHRELYLYSFDTGRLTCASCNPSGRPATADALTDVREGAGVSGLTSKLSHALSDDGHKVFFSTAEALVPEDTNGRPDAYEYDALTGAVHLISTGTGSSPSYFIDADANGDNVFFATRDRLVGWDVDDSYDLYDARVGGGFPDPVPPAAPCTGQACRRPGTPGPSNLAPGSRSLHGAGNQHPHRNAHCKKNQRKVRHNGKVRCVKKRHVKHNRRASR